MIERIEQLTLRRALTQGVVRFWVRVHGGFVKLTLREGDVIRWCETRETDEGWNTKYFQYSWDYGSRLITFDQGEDGRDCDGPTGWHESREVVGIHEDFDEVACRPVRRLTMVRTASGAYDVFAEAAGY